MPDSTRSHKAPRYPRRVAFQTVPCRSSWALRPLMGGGGQLLRRLSARFAFAVLAARSGAWPASVLPTHSHPSPLPPPGMGASCELGEGELKSRRNGQRRAVSSLTASWELAKTAYMSAHVSPTGEHTGFLHACARFRSPCQTRFPRDPKSTPHRPQIGTKWPAPESTPKLPPDGQMQTTENAAVRQAGGSNAGAKRLRHINLSIERRRRPLKLASANCYNSSRP